MFKNAKLKAGVIILMAAIFTFLVFTPSAYAAGKPGGGTTTNAAPQINLGETGLINVDQDTAGTLNLKAIDANKNPMSWKISPTAAPSNGTASVTELTDSKGTSTAVVNFMPRAGFSGSDSFAVVVTDSNNGSDTITITVTINPTAPPQPEPTTAINYVALGDSIALGTNYSTVTVDKPYVEEFYEFLQAQNPTAIVNMKSYATNGDRTNELYAKLGLDGSSGNTELIASVKNADIITLSIGGNNLLRAARDDSSYSGYNFSKIDPVIAEQGLSDFKVQFPQIIEKIKSLNPDAQITLITMYNPYNESDADLHNQVDSYLFRGDGTGINDIIKNSTELGYSIADVYTAFDAFKTNMGAVTFFYPSPYDVWGMLTRNPHPNENGHSKIAALHKAVYTALNK